MTAKFKLCRFHNIVSWMRMAWQFVCAAMHRRRPSVMDDERNHTSNSTSACPAYIGCV